METAYQVGQILAETTTRSETFRTVRAVKEAFSQVTVNGTTWLCGSGSRSNRAGNAFRKDLKNELRNLSRDFAHAVDTPAEESCVVC